MASFEWPVEQQQGGSKLAPWDRRSPDRPAENALNGRFLHEKYGLEAGIPFSWRALSRPVGRHSPALGLLQEHATLRPRTE
ncbi:MAG: hypothetical protein EA401_08600 [Planctomycetota bacterium]|nr:MAG: hypothetical protein EA401_08600 [Planctomycetota bacterium]